MVDCNNCNHDYWCCKDTGVPLTYKEILSGKYEYEIKSLTESMVILGKVFILKKKDGHCMYFDKDKCKIYNYRPSICEKFTCIGRL